MSRDTRRTACAAVTVLTLAVACGEDPFGPPRDDVRGVYSVEWTITYASLSDPAASLLHGRCSGTVRIERQDSRSFDGTITVPAGAEFPCHPASFALTGAIECGETISSMPPYSLIQSCGYMVLSDIEPMLKCTYVAPEPSQVPPQSNIRGVLLRHQPLVLGFHNVYQCASGRYLISSWARERMTSY